MWKTRRIRDEMTLNLVALCSQISIEQSLTTSRMVIVNCPKKDNDKEEINKLFRLRKEKSKGKTSLQPLPSGYISSLDLAFCALAFSLLLAHGYDVSYGRVISFFHVNLA